MSPNQTARFDILGIGNAIVDLLAPATDEFLAEQGMAKGGMALIDAARADALAGAVCNGEWSSGGSVANSCAVAAGLGARTAYLGRVAADPAGEAFRREIAAAGVHFPCVPSRAGAPTARCLIFVTPDAQRTMNTYLGACTEFDADDVDPVLVADSAVTYLEGYLFDPPAAQAAFHRAADLARGAGRRVALSLSDPFCVGRHRDGFRALLRDRVDILFANEAELCGLYETDSLDRAVAAARSEVALAAVTRGAGGSLVLHGGDTTELAAAPATVLDTTGAGDAYAAGFLAGLARGCEPAECGRMGGAAAAGIIGHYGARPKAAARGRD